MKRLKKRIKSEITAVSGNEGKEEPLGDEAGELTQKSYPSCEQKSIHTGPRPKRSC